jgi:hypothetical protein
MSQPFEAVYQDGVFRPTGPVDVPPGATVRLVVVPVPPPDPPFDPDGPTAHDLLKHIIEMPIEPGAVDDGVVVSENVDKILYGGPKGAL